MLVYELFLNLLYSDLADKVNKDWTLLTTTPLNVGESIATPACSEISLEAVDQSGNIWTAMIRYGRIGYIALGGNSIGDVLVERGTTASVKFYRCGTSTSSATPKLSVYYR